MRVNLGDPFETVDIKVYENKAVIFEGSQNAAARFLKVHKQTIQSALKAKSRIKGRFAVRYQSVNQ